MKRFVFTLQSVLNLKRALEKQKMGELAECTARIREHERLLQEHLGQERTQNAQYLRDLEEGLPVSDIRYWGWARRTMRERVEYQNKVLEQAEDERARIEKALVAAMRERKILENLREKQWEEYLAETRKETANEISEFVSHGVSANAAE